MQRVSTSTAVPDLFGTGKPGFRNGNKAAGVPATEFSDAWCNALQEEIANVVEGRGAELDPDNNAQLYEVLAAWIGERTAADMEVITVTADRPLTNADNNKVLVCNDGVELTVSPGLALSSGCVLVQLGTTTVTPAGGAALNFATTAISVPQSHHYALALLQVSASSYVLPIQPVATNASDPSRTSADETPASTGWILSGFSINLNAAKGHIRLPKIFKGFTVQWGRLAVSDDGWVGETFSIPYASVCACVIPTPEATGPMTGERAMSAQASVPTLEGFDVGVSITTGTVHTGYVRYISVGW
jgi:hypothetical protein